MVVMDGIDGVRHVGDDVSSGVDETNTDTGKGGVYMLGGGL